MRPIGSGDYGVGGQGLEPVPDGGKRKAGTLGGLDDGNGSKDTAPVPTLISIGSHAPDESLRFVEMQRRDRYACTLGHFADAQEAVHIFWRDLCQRSEEHTSELQSLMRISYAVFCLKKKKTKNN